MIIKIIILFIWLYVQCTYVMIYGLIHDVLISLIKISLLLFICDIYFTDFLQIFYIISKKYTFVACVI